MSLKSDQNDAMNNINALLNGRETKEGLIDALKSEIGRLAGIHASMQETQAFVLQATQQKLRDEAEEDNNEETQEE